MMPWERQRQEPAAAPAGPRPWERVRSGPAPAPTRPPMPRTGSTEEFGQNLEGIARPALEAAGGFLADQQDIRATQLRNVAHFGGAMGLPTIADVSGAIGLPIREPTADEQARYRDELVSGAVAAATGFAGKAVGATIGDALKYIGRGGRSLPGLERFLGDNAKYVTAAGENIGKMLGPPLSGAAVNEVLDRTNLFGQQQHELAGDVTAGAAGVGTTALVAKNTIDDLLLGNENWRNLMKTPSSGAATGILTATLGYLASRGMLATKDQISDAIDYVAGLFGGEQSPPQQQ